MSSFSPAKVQTICLQNDIQTRNKTKWKLLVFSCTCLRAHEISCTHGVAITCQSFVGSCQDHRIVRNHPNPKTHPMWYDKETPFNVPPPLWAASNWLCLLGLDVVLLDALVYDLLDDVRVEQREGRLVDAAVRSLWRPRNLLHVRLRTWVLLRKNMTRYQNTELENHLP